MKRALAILAAAFVLSACSTALAPTSAPPKPSWDVSGHMAD